MSTEKWTDRWKKLYREKYKDKNTWLIIGIVGLLLLVIALPAGKTDNSGAGDSAGGGIAADHTASDADTAETGIGTEAAAGSQTESVTAGLEQRLEETLSMIDGVGQVRVMLTLKDTGEKVVEKDTSHRSGAGDAATDDSESTVYTKNGSDETPYVSNRMTPQVEGVLVVAQGGGNSLVKQNILQSVMALFPLEAHKITIVKMSMQEVSEHENF